MMINYSEKTKPTTTIINMLHADIFTYIQNKKIMVNWLFRRKDVYKVSSTSDSVVYK